MRPDFTYRCLGLGLALAFGFLGGGCDGSASPSDSDLSGDPCPQAGPGITIDGQGGAAEAVMTPLRRVVLMGGAAEVDSAATVFLNGVAGGDVVILRASGSTSSYIEYFTLTLAPSAGPASIHAIRTDIPANGGDPSVLCYLDRAEAVWLAGGNQWDYLGRWPETVHSALASLTHRGGVVGGTSAGAVVLGEAAFDAMEGSVTSEEALREPLRSDVSLSFPTFAQPELTGILVESHFSQRVREGRLLVCLARFLRDKQAQEVVGIGLDEETALVLRNETFRVYGSAVGGAVWAYRVRGPFVLSPGEPLDLAGVRRVRLEPGTQGAWPLDFDAFQGEDLRVDAGVIGPG